VLQAREGADEVFSGQPLRVKDLWLFQPHPFKVSRMQNVSVLKNGTCTCHSAQQPPCKRTNLPILTETGTRLLNQVATINTAKRRYSRH
jgi:hypothetical protein